MSDNPPPPIRFLTSRFLCSRCDYTTTDLALFKDHVATHPLVIPQETLDRIAARLGLRPK